MADWSEKTLRQLSPRAAPGRRFLAATQPSSRSLVGGRVVACGDQVPLLGSVFGMRPTRASCASAKERRKLLRNYELGLDWFRRRNRCQVDVFLGSMKTPQGGPHEMRPLACDGLEGGVWWVQVDIYEVFSFNFNGSG